MQYRVFFQLVGWSSISLGFSMSLSAQETPRDTAAALNRMKDIVKEKEAERFQGQSLPELMRAMNREEKNLSQEKIAKLQEELGGLQKFKMQTRMSLKRIMEIRKEIAMTQLHEKVKSLGEAINATETLGAMTLDPLLTKQSLQEEELNRLKMKGGPAIEEDMKKAELALAETNQKIADYWKSLDAQIAKANEEDQNRLAMEHMQHRESEGSGEVARPPSRAGDQDQLREPRNLRKHDGM